ncbi:MAG TPA: hypothetical protein VEV39_00730 [Gemmatimonadales bacterium]|nr:hypothetical protein [Gemmatimonadales bacterium]
MWAYCLAVLLSLPHADSSVLKGTVLSLASGHPLAGVTVVEAGGGQVTTDSTGQFEITGSASRLHLTWGGVSGTAVIPAGPTVEALRVVVDTEAPDLDPAVEHVDWHLVGRWGMPGFFDRARQGFGKFFTRDDIARAGFANLRALLKSLDIAHGCLVGGGGCGARTFYRGTPVLVSIYVDGVFQRDENADDRPLGDVAGIEYYPVPYPPRPAATSPDRQWMVKTDYLQQLPLQEFTVVIWTRGFHPGLTTR